MGAAAEHLIVGLDVGTSKVAVVAATRDDEGNLAYVDGTRVESAGIRNGVIVNMQDATEAVERAVYEVEERSGRRITSACISIGGRHLSSQNTRGSTTITPVGREIGHEDIERAIASARANVRLGDNSEVLHEIPRAYMVDGQTGVQDPYDMAGFQLEVETHYSIATSTILQNLLKCVRQARVTPEMVVAAPLAAGEAVRDTYSDAQCLAVVDIGAETTGLTLYVNDTIWLSEVLPLGGATLTRELGAQLKLPVSAAEEIKLRHGHCDPRAVGEYELVDMPQSVAIDAVLPRAEIVRILNERVGVLGDELSQNIRQARRVGVDPEVVVLTGGGANLPGIDSLLMEMLETPVYRGTPGDIRGLPPVMENPAFATTIGLVHWYARYTSHEEGRGMGRRLQALPSSLVSGMKRIFRVVLP
ncbi:MAG: cell division protein FtsA [Ktedonobacterales bacterium]